MKSSCITAGCETAAYVRGLCEQHYAAARRAGTLEEVGLPSRLRGRITDVDVEAKTCTCEVHGPGVRLRIRHRAGRNAAYSCRQCDRGASTPGRRHPSSEPEARRHQRLRHRYGITPEEFFVRLEGQQGRCLICAVAIDEMSANVDHCHTRGHVRGLLCRRCNIGLGWFDDDWSRLARASKYVRRYRERAD